MLRGFGERRPPPRVRVEGWKGIAGALGIHEATAHRRKHEVAADDPIPVQHARNGRVWAWRDELLAWNDRYMAGQG